jgi:hypothetical protein
MGEGTAEYATSAPNELIIVVTDGTLVTGRWRLTCDPPGGDHPDPEAACRAVDTHAAALRPVPKGLNCTQQYGGPQRATVTGQWRGQSVNSTFSLVNGCEIRRWRALRGLLPPVGC